MQKSRKGGTYFGATGCGKTYTMAFLARQLALRCTETPQIGSPTIILIVDRDELQKAGCQAFYKEYRISESWRSVCCERQSAVKGGTWSTAKWWVLYLYDPEVLRP